MYQIKINSTQWKLSKIFLKFLDKLTDSQGKCNIAPPLRSE